MKFLVIQTAFLGDVILASSITEKLHQHYPEAEIDFLLRKGNEVVFDGHPYIREIITLDKKKNKWKNLFTVSSKVRNKKYDYVINLHRFSSSGYITWRSGARNKIGFDKNPFSFCYTKKIKHEIGSGKHEIDRNHQLIQHLTDATPAKPALHPSAKDFQYISSFTPKTYYCIAPASVWYTKQFPKEKWMELINSINGADSVFLIGSADDIKLCDEIKLGSTNNKIKIENLCGKLSLLQTASLMKGSVMNYVNDSAPAHIATATNSKVTQIFCSTVPAFGFSALTDNAVIVETKEKLDCRPCGLHGYTKCPKGHFKCATTISIKDLVL